ncbi:MAG: hypothetical protein RL060_934 [Bacteroidota bacterium]|jgi:hypothetical protein
MYQANILLKSQYNVDKLKSFVAEKSVTICLISQICVPFCFYALSKHTPASAGWNAAHAA